MLWGWEGLVQNLRWPYGTYCLSMGSASQCWQLGSTHLVPSISHSGQTMPSDDLMSLRWHEVVGLNDVTLGSNTEGGWHLCWAVDSGDVACKSAVVMSSMDMDGHCGHGWPLWTWDNHLLKF